MTAREFINGAPEIGDAAALPPTAQACYAMDGTIPDPVSAGPGSASNGTAGVSEIGAEITVTETSGRPAEPEPAHAALLETENNPEALGIAGPQLQPAEPRRKLHLSLSHNNAQSTETPEHDGRVADMSE